jgi:hypothetical protein
MRVIAWLLVVAVILLGLALGYSLYAAALQTAVTEVVVVPAVERQEEFDELRRAVEERALLGSQFVEEPLGDPADYEFHVYDVTVSNNGFLPADWIRLDVQPEAGDVLQVDREGVNLLPSMSSGTLEATVLARRGTPTARRLSLTYFIWSRLYNLPVVVQ